MSRNNRTPTNTDVFAGLHVGKAAGRISEDGNPLEEARLLPIGQVQPNPAQPRKKASPEQDAELAKDIEERGILQPIIVRAIVGKSNRYEIVAGERRWRAANQAGLEEVPVIIKELDDQEAQLISLVENLQRLDLDPHDEALFFQKLETEYNLSYHKIGRMINRSHGYVSNRIKSLTEEGTSPQNPSAEPTPLDKPTPAPVRERPKPQTKNWSYRPQNFQKIRSYIGETLDNWQQVETGKNRESLLQEVSSLKEELTRLEKKLQGKSR